MFVFGCGRCDLAGGDPNQMYETLTKIRENLPTDTVLLPGHNYSVKPTSSLAEEIEGNPFLHFDHVEDFVKYRMHDHDRIRHSPYDAVHK
jgi:glyoxylase-like metal-dependent hydrolase (beta-lactamase superfamily II)